MKPKSKLLILTQGLLLLSVFQGQNAQACLSILKDFRSQFSTAAGGSSDLCQLADRYQAAKTRLASQNIDALKIADVRAPRLIKVAHWERRKNAFLPFGNNYDPRFMYDRTGQPHGSVWAGWDLAALTVDTWAQTYLTQIENQSFGGFDFSQGTLNHLHSLSMSMAESRIAGTMRTGVTVGRAASKSEAPTLAQSQTVSRASYPSYTNHVPNGRTILSWVDTECIDNLPTSLKDQISQNRIFRADLLPVPGSPFVDAQGVQRKCGYYIYANAAEVNSQLSRLQTDVNRRMITLMRSSRQQQSKEIDPIFIAARTQRWFVSIHPFNGGNGRLSRLYMDKVLQSVGLPAPIIADVDQDLTTTEENWAVEIAKGIEKTIQILEACAVNPSVRKCSEVPRNSI